MNANFRFLLLPVAALPLSACVDPYYAGAYPPPPLPPPAPVVVAPARPVYVAPPPVVVAPRPVYVAPRPVYVAPRPIYRPAYGYGYYHGVRRW